MAHLCFCLKIDRFTERRILMIDKKPYEVDFDFFSTQFIDGILWVYFQKNLFIQATNLANRDALLSYSGPRVCL